MDIFWTIFVAAFIVQFLSDIVKQPIPVEHRAWSVPIISIVLSVAFCLFGHVDLFPAIGITFDIDWLGELFTAIAISGGATGVNELIKVLRNKKIELEDTATSNVIGDVLATLADVANTESDKDKKDE